MKWYDRIKNTREDAFIALMTYLNLYNDDFKLDALEDLVMSLIDSDVIEIEHYEVY